ncbi:aminoglycoside phosphotransferase family protein [Kineosporia sp. R_H_3]|uniref:aminoglycoside phosphotransferase family protein n=1 Tax=Kineosporia sp. R_H_3 TaxID=1961848 RepID=UPI000B4C16F0|nr:aminoglycoside phosphotransferase family protein [Kineosporia sp. R_H_3]
MSAGPDLPDLVVPAAFVEQRAARCGEAGRAWAAAIPATVADVLARWRLRRDPLDLRVRFGDLAVTVPVLTGAGKRAVLRVAWRDGSAEAVIRALVAWGGRGVVALLDADADAGVLLLERLDPDRSLHVLPLQRASEVAGHLLRRLAIDPPAGLVTSAEVAAAAAGSFVERDSRLGGPVPGRILYAALHAAQAVCRPMQHRLVHADLHYGNVLAGAREPWLAIDPRPVAGDPELGVAELLWTRYADLDEPGDVLPLLVGIVRAGHLDQVRARDWALVRVVDYWLWGLENGLTIDPPRCARIATVLAGA